MHFVLNLLCFLYIVVASIAQAPRSGCDIITSEGKCFSFFTHSEINWEQARTRCQTWGGDLASIASLSEDLALKSIRNTSYTRCSIGLNDKDTEGVYVWSDGSNSTYRNWNSGEPNNGNGVEDCSNTDHGGNYWNDCPCTILKRNCHYCSSQTVRYFGRIIQNYNGFLSNNTILSEDTTLYCVTENKNTPHVTWSYVDLDGSRSVLSSSTNITTGVSVLKVTTDKPGYYSCQVTVEGGVSKMYTVMLQDPSSFVDNQELALNPDLMERTITVGSGNVTAECIDPFQRGLEISWNNITTLPENHGVTLLGNKLNIMDNGLPVGVYVFECVGENMQIKKGLNLTIEFLSANSSLMTINEIMLNENATLTETNQRIELVLTYSNAKEENNTGTFSTSEYETLVNATLILSENLEGFASEVSNDTINSLVEVTSNLLDIPNTIEQENNNKLEVSTTKLVSVIEIVGAISLSGLNANVTERVFTSERVKLISQIIPLENDTKPLTIPKSDNPEINERVSIPRTVVGDLSSDGEFRYSNAIINVVSNTSNSANDFSLGSSLLSLTVSTEKKRINLTSPILLTFYTPNLNNHEARCVFLDEDNSIFNTTGLSLNSSEGNLTVCESNHLTSFGVLIRSKDQKVDPQESQALSIISYILLSCSLIALILSILIFIVIGKEFFRVEMNRIYFNYALALAFAITVFIFGTELPRSNTIACSVFVGLMHYFWLAVFSWGLCISVEIVYLLWITSLNRKALFWFLFPFGWGLPVPIVVTTFVVSHFRYKTYIYQSFEYCFLSYTNGVMWSFIGPILVMFLLNMIGLFLAFVKIVSVTKSSGEKSASSSFTIAKQSLINSSLLFPVLGAPWIVLPFNLISNSFISTTVFEWLFIIATSPSGILFFILFALRNDTVRQKFARKKIPSSPKPSPSLISSRVKSGKFQKIHQPNSTYSIEGAFLGVLPLIEMQITEMSSESTDIVSMKQNLKSISSNVMPDIKKVYP